MPADQARKKVLYIAPELPALSATFVYNELFELRRLGHGVVPVSVHRPAHDAGEAVNDRLGEVFFLYESGGGSWLVSALASVLSGPLRFCAAITLLIKDVLSAGVFSRLGAGLIYRFLASCELARLVKARGVSHIHAHFAHVPADIAMYAAKIAGIDFSVMGHANDLFQRGWLLAEKIDRSAFFATISRYNVEYLSRFNADRGKIKIIRCGVDGACFTRPQGRAQNSPARLGFLGRLVEKKGVDVLLRAAKTVQQSGVEFDLEIAGDGPESARLRELAGELGLSGVRFLGSMDHGRVASWLGSLDGFILPCVKDSNGDMDGIPVSLMEAMLAGVPVVSTDLSGVPELVIPHETGYVAESASAASLAEKVLELLGESREEGERRVQAAISHVKKEFDMAGNARALSGLIEGDR